VLPEQTTIEFGEHTQTLSRKYTPRNASRTTKAIERHAQKITVREGPHAGTHTSESIRLVYSCGINVSKDLADQLVPKYGDWTGNVTAHDALATTVFAGTIKNGQFGRSMQRWFKQIPGFGPCFSFIGDIRPDSKLGKTVKKHALDKRLIINGRKMRVLPYGVGLYLGPKGQQKKNDRDNRTIYLLQDPRKMPDDATGKHYLAPAINLDLKFCLAYEGEAEGSATIPMRHFFYGEYPMVTISFNVHFNSSPDTDAIDQWADLERAMCTELAGFEDFICQSSITKNLLSIGCSKTIHDWKTVPKMMRKHTPKHVDFLFKEVPGDPFTATKEVHGVPAATATYPPEEKKEVIPSTSSLFLDHEKRSGATNRFTAFDDSDESDESDASDASDESDDPTPG
jgi:hypothetical protein